MVASDAKEDAAPKFAEAEVGLGLVERVDCSLSKSSCVFPKTTLENALRRLGVNGGLDDL
jgi:hypothetical protein